jgi:hypothetical protein
MGNVIRALLLALVLAAGLGSLVAGIAGAGMAP